MDYFELLKQLYQIIFPQCSVEEQIRTLFLKERKESLNELIQKLFQCKSLDEKLENLLTVSSHIVLFQPFYDGNHRVASAFMSGYLLQEGYLLSMEKIQQEQLIPIIYEEKEPILQNKVDILQKKLKPNHSFQTRSNCYK